jgi:formylglycine-generating enzyme required for sulfatase activity
VATVSFNSTTGVATITGVGVGDYETVYDEEYWEEREVLLPITITATSAADNTKKASCEVYVDLGMLEFMKPVQRTNTSFLMGSLSGEQGRKSDETQHSVTLTKGFYMGISQVFTKHYIQRMGVNPSLFNYPEELDYYDEWNEEMGTSPIENVTWYDAVEFCNRQSEHEGFTRVYTITDKVESGMNIISATVTADWNANGYRLPTEAEWEYACRAGTTTPWNTGDTIQHLTAGPMGIASLGDANFADPTGWGLYTQQAYYWYEPPNNWGLYVMHGNLEEWCWDWYSATYYANGQSNPTGPATGTQRVARGGSMVDYAVDVRSAARRAYAPDTVVDQDEWKCFIGFRVVRNMP